MRSGGQAVSPDVGSSARGAGASADLARLLDQLPEEVVRRVFTHSSWTDRRSDSYERLGFLGDSGLGLAVSTHLSPRLDAEQYGPGRLTKIRAQAVSGRSCRAVALPLRGPVRPRATAPVGAVGLVPHVYT